MKSKRKAPNSKQDGVTTELHRLNRVAGKALKQGTPEHRLIFEKHRKAWAELAKR